MLSPHSIDKQNSLENLVWKIGPLLILCHRFSPPDSRLLELCLGHSDLRLDDSLSFDLARSRLDLRSSRCSASPRRRSAPAPGPGCLQQGRWFAARLHQFAARCCKQAEPVQSSDRQFWRNNPVPHFVCSRSRDRAPTHHRHPLQSGVCVFFRSAANNDLSFCTQDDSVSVPPTGAFSAFLFFAPSAANVLQSCCN
ncbi:hypothetical protein Mpal_0627 [Methanosphaerula palustris E1-9c]|uniref:Uncharacterized protein n=1 Tax=Methanosphaerula palustris (strain ATCC BAA-1556 / DSM 19958 / E1-9c) TaxID=521011 RepID=B8GFF0_METPE|nr:hypothetical protein Mpal_0627 [Methanosphaerula palustris E1-9c]